MNARKEWARDRKAAPRTYTVTVVGRMNEYAVYTIAAPNKPDAKRAARRLALEDYISGSPRNFKWSPYPVVTGCERNEP